MPAPLGGVHLHPQPPTTATTIATDAEMSQNMLLSLSGYYWLDEPWQPPPTWRPPDHLTQVHAQTSENLGSLAGEHHNHKGAPQRLPSHEDEGSLALDTSTHSKW